MIREPSFGRLWSVEIVQDAYLDPRRPGIGGRKQAAAIVNAVVDSYLAYNGESTSQCELQATEEPSGSA